MPKYRALELSFANGRLVNAGEIIDLEGEVHASHFEIADRNAQRGPMPKPIPPDVERLVNTVRMHAATRGASPDEVNESDFDAVLKNVTPVPAQEVVKAAAAKCGVSLGQSLG